MRSGRVYYVPDSASNGNVGNAQEDTPPDGDKNVTAGESGNVVGNASEAPNASGSKSSAKNVTDVTDDNKVVQMVMWLDSEQSSEDIRFLKLVGERYGKDTHSDSDFLSIAKDAGYDLGDERHQEDALSRILDKLTGLSSLLQPSPAQEWPDCFDAAIADAVEFVVEDHSCI